MHISDSLPLQTIQLLFYFKMMDIFSWVTYLLAA